MPIPPRNTFRDADMSARLYSRRRWVANRLLRCRFRGPEISALGFTYPADFLAADGVHPSAGDGAPWRPSLCRWWTHPTRTGPAPQRTCLAGEKRPTCSMYVSCAVIAACRHPHPHPIAEIHEVSRLQLCHLCFYFMRAGAAMPRRDTSTSRPSTRPQPAVMAGGRRATTARRSAAAHVPADTATGRRATATAPRSGRHAGARRTQRSQRRATSRCTRW